MHNDDRFAELDSLSDWQLENEDQDIRGFHVKSMAGEDYGTIEDMLVDKDNERVAAVRLNDGRIVAASHLDIRSDHVLYTDDEAASTPNYTKVRARD
ncbi:PRC-barrel domain-containing protein [Qipengyuania nanhaisediminis]|uniref:PRC-barrel domain-containing protein n=1 Tax=Qipengyuania nanhaisediminis TaxID=604088 RepID=UPI0038B37F77